VIKNSKRNDKMKSEDKKVNIKLYDIGEKIGLNKKEMNNLLNDHPQRIEQSSLLLGPKPYWATFYGTISIKDFQ